MNWNNWIRQSHRWLSMIFTLIVVILIGVAVGQVAVAEWVYYLPLPFLALMIPTGLYLFVLPYLAKGRSAQRAARSE